jgi:hypothetical protein
MVSGCGVFRKSIRPEDSNYTPEGFVLYGDIVDNNITSKGVFVRKGRIESLVNGVRDRFTINLRVSEKGDWLVSVRSFAGIEIARIHADREAVTILDRLARNATIFTWNDINRQFGLTYEMLPAILGDIPENKGLRKKKIHCTNPLLVSVGWADFVVTPDCTQLKVSSMIISDNVFKREVEISLSEFKKSGETEIYPQIVEVMELTGNFSLNIFFEDVVTGWNEEIEFVIPSGYKVKR